MQHRLQPAEVQSLPVATLIDRVLAHASEPYACLGLPPGAATSSVRVRYLALVQRVHPDKAAGQPRAREAFNAVDGAFRSLKRGSRW